MLTHVVCHNYPKWYTLCTINVPRYTLKSSKFLRLPTLRNTYIRTHYKFKSEGV